MHLWARATQPRRQTLLHTVGGYPLTTVMTLKMYLQRAVRPQIKLIRSQIKLIN